MISRKYRVFKMSCASCSSHVERIVSSIEGVNEVSVNLLSGLMNVVFDEESCNDEIIMSKVIKGGYDIKIFQNELHYEKKDRLMFSKVVLSLVFLVLLMYVSMGAMLKLPTLKYFREIEYGLYFSLTQIIILIPIVILNFHYFTSGFKRLIKLSPNMDSLIMISTFASILYGLVNTVIMAYFIYNGNLHRAHEYHMQLYFETAGTIFTLVSFGKYLESRSKRKTSEAIDELLNLQSKTAIVLENNIEVIKDINDIVIGDIILIKPGMSIPVDGIIVDGASTIDEAYLTGESIPVYKKKDDLVVSGTVNQNGFFTYKATKIKEDSTINEIIKLVEEAANSKAPISQLADRISLYFVPFVILISIITFLVWFLITKDFEFSFSFSLSVLVIACPCALGLATPLSVMVGTKKAASLKILVRSAQSLQIAHSVDTIVLDKTGTITNGKPEVKKILTFNNFSEDELLQIAFSLENNTTHPLADAVVNYSKEHNISLLKTKDFSLVGGLGINALINDKRYYAGNISYIKQNNIDVSGITELIDENSKKGYTPLIFSDQDKVIGFIFVFDEIKPSTKYAIKLFKKLNLDVIMLTGDNSITAFVVANEVGISKVFHQVLPAQKQEVIKDLKNQNKVVCMIGDGVNDSIALTEANIGMAVSNASDICNLSADIILLKHDLLSAYEAIKLSRVVFKNVKTNLFWAFFYNFVSLPVAAGVLYYLLNIRLTADIAALCMCLSSLCVVFNALRLRNYKSDVVGGSSMTKSFIVEKMMCQRCVEHIRKGLTELNEVKAVRCDLNKKKIDVVFKKEELDNEVIINKLKEIGYEATVFDINKVLFRKR